MQLTIEFPKSDSGRYTHIERVLCAVHRYLYCGIGDVDDTLVDAAHLIARHQQHPRRSLLQGGKTELLQRYGIMGLLKHIHAHPLILQSAHLLKGIGHMPPGHTQFGAESCLRYFRRRGHRGDACHHHLLHEKGVGSAQHRPYVLGRAHIVGHQTERQFVQLAILPDSAMREFKNVFLASVSHRSGKLKHTVDGAQGACGKLGIYLDDRGLI